MIKIASIVTLCLYLTINFFCFCEGSAEAMMNKCDKDRHERRAEVVFPGYAVGCWFLERR